MLNAQSPPVEPRRISRGAVALACACLLLPGEGVVLAQATPATPPAAAASEAAVKLPPEQLDSLVAPIALYPDPLLAQTLAASTYPLELIQLQQWMEKNPNLKDKALADAVAKQPWDPAVQSMAAFPDAVKRLADDIQWTTDLGNSFLAQQGDVMEACQRMRKKAKGNDALKTTEQVIVETKVIEKKEVIVIQPANPEVIYVPSYSPTYVYGPPAYPYPPVYYPPYVPGAAFVSFTAGVMIGAAIWGGAWGHCGWGHNNVNVNINNNFNRNSNVNTGNINRGNVNTGNRGGGNSWSHNSQHRGGAPYADKATANKFGGQARGDSLSSRQSSARQQQSRGGASAGNRASGGGGQGKLGGGNFSSTSPNVSDRAAAGGSRGSDRGGSSSSFDRGGSGSDRVGSRDIGSSSRGSSGSRGSSFGSSGGYSGGSARASSSRGASSYGGGSRGGGGRGGGGRGGRR